MKNFLLAVTTLICLQLAAQGFSFQEYQMRHSNALQKMEAGSILVMRSADNPIHDAAPSVFDADFLYMTGEKTPFQYFVLSKDGVMLGNQVVHRLFFSDDFEGESTKAFDTLLPASMFNSIFEKALQNSKTLYLSAPDLYFRADWINKRMFYPLKDATKKLKSNYPNLAIKNAGNLIAGLREIKSEQEIKMVEKAIEITGEGLLNAFKICRTGETEYTLQAEIGYIMHKNNEPLPAFRSIIAGGRNALEIHYQKNNDSLIPGTLVVFDVGARWKGYCADISRTFPVNGTFSPLQEDLYNSILSIQEELIRMVKPGLNIQAIDQKAKELMKARGWANYLTHGVTHSLGLEVHDPLQSGVLQEGMIITIEPGIYIPVNDEDWPPELRGTGIRIEDDILITKEAYKVLSSSIPKTIEALMTLLPKKLSTNN